MLGHNHLGRGFDGRLGVFAQDLDGEAAIFVEGHEVRRRVRSGEPVAQIRCVIDPHVGIWEGLGGVADGQGHGLNVGGNDGDVRC